MSPFADQERLRALDALSVLTLAIARATSAEQLYDAALDALAAAIGARRAAVLIYDDAGVMRFRAWRDLSDAYRALAEGHSPWRRDERHPQSVVVADAYADPALASLRPAFEAEGIRALAFIPLVAREELLGKFMVYWAEPHEATEVELEVVRGIADRVAHGLHRLRTEEALRASHDQLEAILVAIADGVTAQDTAGHLVFANPAAARLIGFDSVEELLNTPPSAIMDRFELFDEHGKPFEPGDLPGRHALAGEVPPPVLVRFRARENGEDRWSVVSASPVIDSNGVVQLAINIFRDVTATQEARERERFLAAIGEVLATSLDYETTLKSVARLMVPVLADWCRIDIVDPGDTIRNIAVEHRDPRMLERAEEMMRRFPPNPERSAVLSVVRSGESSLIPSVTDEMLLAADLDPEYLAFLREVGIRSVMTIPLKARGRSLAALSLVAASPRRRYTAADLAFAEDVARSAALAIDNALLFRQEQEARQREQAARADAEAANRAKDEFLATLSHELRTPLTAILGWSRMLTTMSVDPKMTADALQAIARSAEAQARIVDDLLDVSRIVTGKLRLEVVPLRLRAVIDAAVAAVRPAAEAKRITIDNTAVADAVVRGDADRLQQVFWNLLTNAVKFTPYDGRVEITTEPRGEQIAIAVGDTGSGIGPDLLPFIFERFRQGDSGPTRSFGGLGLGLAIVKSLVELHGGVVSASSDGNGKGSSFTVTLPVAVANAATVPERRVSERALEGRRILLVEDEPETRGFLRALLEVRGAEVLAAADVGEAINVLKDWQPHAIISDIAMPGEDGYAFIRRLREPGTHTQVPAIAVTAYGREEDAARAISAGFDSFMRKPIDPEAFIEAIASMAKTTANS
jgi:PAS domain S-box-containing protein